MRTVKTNKEKISLYFEQVSYSTDNQAKQKAEPKVLKRKGT